MTEILQVWLARRIALATDATLDSISQVARDGRLFGDLLYNYNVISSEQRSQLIPTEDEEAALHNLTKYVKVWLKTIGIECTTEMLYDISRGKGSAAVKLLYEMYLVLQDKDALYFSEQQVRKSVLPSADSRFLVSRVPDEGPPFPAIKPNALSYPLVQQKHTIQWHRERLENLKEKCKETREKYQKYLQETFASPPKEDKRECCVSLSEDKMETVGLEPVESKDALYEELVAEETTAKETELPEVDPEKARRQMKQIASKNRQKAEEKAKKIREQKVLLLEMWEKLLKQQERQFDEVISKRFVQQSQYEKQMTTKMLHTRQHRENMMEHRKALEEEVDEEKQHEFINALLIKELSKNTQRDNYYYEKERDLELHRRLYAEKLRLKAERLHNMCLQCVKDITDVAIRHSEFKQQYLVDVPRRVSEKWKNLFIKGQPIFDLLDQPEDLVQGCLEDLPEDIEEIYSVELSRQNAMDEADFESYSEYKWPFELEKHNLYDENKLRVIELGTNILGHIIHRLLLTKYPKPPKPPRPDLPPVTVAACINGLTDESALPTLQRLLNLRGIRLVTLEASVNFCLQAYKDETREEYEDPTKVLEAETETALKKLDKKSKKKGVEAKGKKKNAKAKPKALNENSDVKVSASATVAVQTPRIFPDDEIILSRPAQLGSRLIEFASLGECLPYDLAAAAFVQFLQTMRDIQGWALVNFPFNIEQAAYLEEALTARPFPPFAPQEEKSVEDIADVVERERCCYQEDDNEEKRKSKILPDPEAPTEEELLYRTCLTAFINLKQPSENLPADLAQLPPMSEILEPSADPLERFYTEQGCNYTFYYKTFDIPTIKHLAKLIIGEFTIPPKTSLELFGDTVFYVEQGLDDRGTKMSDKAKSVKKSAEKQPKVKKSVKGKEKESSQPAPESDKPAKGKGKDKGKKEKGGKKKAPVVIIREDKETQAPDLEEEIIEIFVEEEPPALPGEKRWVYADLPLSEQFEAILATSWENSEDVYITDLKQLFFVRRTLLDAVIPYTSYVKRHMTEFIARPDNKLEYMREFQRMYNALDADMRDDEEVKAELHCRLAEFREKLWTISDVRREESENERKRIIGENWVTIQVKCITNNAILMLQIELDRYVETMQLLSDYYLATITRIPLDFDFNKASLTLMASGSSTEQVSSKLTGAIEYMLTQCDSATTNTPFHEAMRSAHTYALHFTEDIYSACLEAFKKGSSVFLTAKEKKPAKGKKVIAEPDPQIKEKAEAVMAEWTAALKGEIERLKLRLALLKAVGVKDLEDVFRCSQETFHGIYNEIKKRYESEIENIEAACRLIACAIEAEMPLQPQLILEGDRFYVQPDVVLFPDELPPAEPPVSEPDLEGVFRIEQLDRMVDIFFDLAPSGFMIGRRFTFVLQDMVILEAEDGREPMVPDLYKKLRPREVELFLKQLFGNTECIDWKDFIIYQLHVKFPTEEEILNARYQFHTYDPDNTELVKDYQFFEAKLWFENATTPEEQKRQSLIKNLLFKMYKINEDTINYTAMLLAFCKDENVVVGVAKALALSLGKYVCWDVAVGNVCVEALLCQRAADEEAEQRHDKQREENVEAAAAIVDDLIDHTVHVCDSVVIEDVISEKTIEVDDVDSRWLNPDLQIYSSASLVDAEKFLEVETDVAPTPGKVYFLPFETLITVISAALPWHVRTQNLLEHSLREHLEVIYDSCRSELFNGAVLAHEFLNNVHFLRVIQVTFKFVAKQPVRIVKDLLDM